MLAARRQAAGLADDLIVRALSSSSARHSSKRPRPAPAPQAPSVAADAVATTSSQLTQPAPVGQQWTEVVHPQTGAHALWAGAGVSTDQVSSHPVALACSHWHASAARAPPPPPPPPAGLVYWWNQRTGETTALGEPRPGPEGRLQQYRGPAAAGPAQAARGLGQLVLMGAGVGLAFALFARLF